MHGAIGSCAEDDACVQRVWKKVRQALTTICNGGGGGGGGVAEISHDFAQRFAEEWVAAWNSHSLDRVLAHYAEDFTMASPRIIAVAGEPSGVLRGKPQVRAYWARALSLVPDLRFELRGAYAGVGCVVVHYENQRKQLCAEVFFFFADDNGPTVVRAATATYAQL